MGKAWASAAIGWTNAFSSPHSWRNERRTHNETTAPSGHLYRKARSAGCLPPGSAASGVPETVRQEDGCLRYDYFLSAERPDEILLIEEWASAEQQQTHLRQPHMQQLKQQKEQYIAETDVQTL